MKTGNQIPRPNTSSVSGIEPESITMEEAEDLSFDGLFHISEPIEDMDPILLEHLTSSIMDAVDTFKQQSKNSQFPTWDQFIKRMKMGIANDGEDTAEQTRRLDEMYGFLANVWGHLREDNPNYQELHKLTPEIIAKVYQKHVSSIGLNALGMVEAVEAFEKRQAQRQQPTSVQPANSQTPQTTPETPDGQPSNTPTPRTISHDKSDTLKISYEEYQNRVLDAIDYRSYLEHSNKNVEPDLTASHSLSTSIQKRINWSCDPFLVDHTRGLMSEKLLTGEIKEGDQFTLIIPTNEIANNTEIDYYELVEGKDGRFSAIRHVTTWREFKAGKNIFYRELTENDRLYWRYIPLYAQNANGDNVFSIATESRFQNPTAIGFEILPTDTKEEIQEKNTSRKAVQIEGMAKLNALRFEVAQNYRANHNQNAIADNNTHTTVKVTEFVEDTGYAVSVYNSENAEQTEFKRIAEVRSDAKKTQYGYIKFDNRGGYKIYRPNGKPIFRREIYHDFTQHLDKTQINGLLVEIKESPVNGQVVIIPIQYGGLPTAEQSQLGGELRAYIIDSLLNGDSKSEPLVKVIEEINASNSTILTLNRDSDLFVPYHANVSSKTAIQVSKAGDYYVSYWDRSASILTRIISYKKRDGSHAVWYVAYKYTFQTQRQGYVEAIANCEVDLTNTADKDTIVAKLQTALNYFVVSPYLMNMSGKRVKTINTSSRTVTYYTIDSSGVKTPKTVHIKDVLDDSAQTSFLSHPVEKSDGTIQDVVLFQPKIKIELYKGDKQECSVEEDETEATGEDKEDEIEAMIASIKRMYGENSREAREQEDLLRRVQALLRDKKTI